jgi:PAS domain S-box-containing protein
MKETFTETAGNERSLADILPKALFENSLAGIILFKSIRDHSGKVADFEYSYINKKAEVLLNRTGLAGKHLLRIFPDAKTSGVFGKYVEVVESGAVLDEEIAINQDGADKWVCLKAEKVEDGCLVFYSDLTSRNLTENKKMEEALEESELRFRTIVETANEGICQVDENFKIIYVNNKLADMGGFSVSELKGKPIFDFMKEESKSMLIKKLVNLTPGTKRSYELKLLKKGGGDIIASVNAIAIRSNDGKYMGSIGMITDITDRINIERDLKKTKKRLENALENGRIGTWEWNIKTGELLLDKRTEEMFGLKTGTFEGNASGFESFVHEEDHQHVREIIEKSLTSVQPFEIIFRTRPRYGKSNYISAKALVIRDKKRRPVSMSGVCFDVTDMKEGAEKALIKLNEDLLRSNSDLQQFAYVASHDLQEPLRMISSFTQLLQHRYQNRLDEDANEYIHYAVEGSKRMYALLNGLLAYSRVHTRGMEFGEVNMNDVVARVKDNLRLVIGETLAVIEYNKLPVISADDNQMIQLMQNLIENGIKFSKDIPRITISAVQKGEYEVFSVADEGIGIEPQYFERIFKIFQKLHRSDEYGGTGIGLAICKRIAERHGGRIWVSSNPGEGSTFSFSIPRKRKMTL